jgi:abnormal spindle-like microcephaly-associated protein
LIRKQQQIWTKASVQIQRTVRGFLVQLEYHLQLIDIILVQSVVRRWLVHRDTKRRLEAVLCLQRVARSLRSRTLLKKRRELYRRHRAATFIQKTWRCYNVHVDYMLLILSAIAIQSTVRRFQSSIRFAEARHAAMRIQETARKWLALRIEATSARKIQATVRTFLASLAFHRQRSAAIIIQRVSRGFVARLDINLSHFAATEIQRIWRGHQCSTDFVVKILSVICIQSAVRASLAKRRVDLLRREQLLETAERMFVERQASKLQAAIRQYLVRRRIDQHIASVQCLVRGFIARRRVRTLKVRLVALQSLARGSIARMHRSKKVAVIARRIHRANIQARKDPSMCLGARTASALLVVQKSTSLSEIMAAIVTLEMSTRLSLACCVAFTECTATEILFSLIRTCNRSLPHVELLSHVLLTFRNVVKHKELLPRVASADSAEVFMDLVQMFRDKENVFCSAAVLLHLVVASNQQVKVSTAPLFNWDSIVPTLVLTMFTFLPRLLDIDPVRVDGKYQTPQGSALALYAQAISLLNR